MGDKIFWSQADCRHFVSIKHINQLCFKPRIIMAWDYSSERCDIQFYHHRCRRSFQCFTTVLGLKQKKRFSLFIASAFASTVNLLSQTHSHTRMHCVQSFSLWGVLGVFVVMHMKFVLQLLSFKPAILTMFSQKNIPSSFFADIGRTSKLLQVQKSTQIRYDQKWYSSIQ